MQTYIQKNNLERADINIIATDLPDLKNIKESKAVAICKWLTGRLKACLKDCSISVNNLLPSKAEFAYTLGVSIGTMQNALRYIEDLGIVESKQCIGTLVKDYKKKNSAMRKLTSKREIAVESIKRYILQNNIQQGEHLP